MIAGTLAAGAMSALLHLGLIVAFICAAAYFDGNTRRDGK